MMNLLKYRNASFEELKLITPKWAYGENKNKIMDFALKGRDKTYKIFVVETKTLIENASFADVSFDSLYTNTEKNDMRISRILFRWDNNEFVDPPTVYLESPRSMKILFRDGQHRAKLSFFLDFESIPIGIHNEDISRVKNILKFK